MPSCVAVVAVAALLDASAYETPTSCHPDAYAKIVANQQPMFEKIRDHLRNISDSLTGTETRVVLDIGTGPGEPSTLIAKSMPDAYVIATDAQAPMIEQAKQRSAGLQNIQHAVVSGDDLSSFMANKFDFVTMCYSLMFIRDRVKSIAEVARVLKPGGTAFIAVWKDFQLFKLTTKALHATLGEPVSPQINPMALSEFQAVEELVEGTQNLEVCAEELVSYDFYLDSHEVCEGAMFAVWPALVGKNEQETALLKDKFCKSFVSLAENAGYLQTDNSVRIPNNVAQLLTVRKLLSRSEL